MPAENSEIKEFQDPVISPITVRRLMKSERRKINKMTSLTKKLLDYLIIYEQKQVLRRN